MNKNVHIIFMAFAIIVMLTVSFFPHHHHDGMVCTAVEYCDDDGKYNDEHTGHSSDHTLCLENSDYIVSKQETHNNDLSFTILPLFIIAENIILFGNNFKEELRKPSVYRQSLYRSADVCSINTRRGPPILFV